MLNEAAAKEANESAGGRGAGAPGAAAAPRAARARAPAAPARAPRRRCRGGRRAPAKLRAQLDEFVYDYLLRRYDGSHTKAIEWGYNLYDALERYVSDSDCKLFLKILAGELAEEVRSDQLALIVQVKQAMEKEDASLNQGMPCGSLTIPNFMRTLRKLLPAKSEHSMTRLQRILQLEQQHIKQRMVLYGALLKEDSEGNQTRFCETLREQHLTEIIAYSKQLIDSIHQVHAREGSQAKLTIAQYREAILLSDPEKPRPEQNVYLARGIGKPDVQEMLNMERDGSHTFPLETFCSLVQKGLLKRSTPVNSKGL